MTTVAQMIARTQRHLFNETRGQKNRLTAGIDAAATTLTFDFDLGGIVAGSVICIDLEEMHVWSASASTAVVERAANGTTAAIHALGAAVQVNPKYSSASILTALNEDLNDLSAEGLYRVATVEVTYDTGTDAYNLTGVTDLTSIIEVTFDANDGTERWPVLPRSQWRIARNLDTNDFASGTALMVNGYVEPGRPLRIAYKAPFTATLASLAQVVETVAGLPVHLHDLPPLGAALNLTAGAEISRNFLTQGDTRRADEVPAGARSGMARMLMARRAQRINGERARLYAKHPMVR